MNYHISSVEFNVREISKQLLLLEDHLFDYNKRCMDCIRKHLLLIEAFAEESNSLDSKSNWFCFNHKIAKKAREWIILLSTGNNFLYVAQQARSIRKQLVPLTYDPRHTGDPSELSGF
jgi:hypothetical protein